MLHDDGGSKTAMSDTDIRFAKLVKIIERLTKVIEKEMPETQLMAAMGLVLTVANSYDEDRLVPVFKSFVAQFEVEAKAARPN
jgi:hypothetical protein